MSAYNSIDEAYANAVQVLTDAANSDGLGIVELEAILSDVDAAYEDTESWFDWGESEAGAFWANLAARSVYWSAFSDDRQARIDAWLAQVPVAVASSAQTVEDQSYYTIAAGTVEASAADAKAAGEQAATAAGDWRVWAAAAAAGAVLLRVVGRI